MKPSQNYDIENVIRKFRGIRRTTEMLVEPLSVDDFAVQGNPDVSPLKWHLGHTSWFFEKFVLSTYEPGYKNFDEGFDFIYNSYYESLGKYLKKEDRGKISRPLLSTIMEYRRTITEKVVGIMESGNLPLDDILPVIVLGINHEQQHQELILMDIKYNFFINYDKPYYTKSVPRSGKAETPEWRTYEEGVYEIGHDGKGFAFDNESPVHKVYINKFSLSTVPVTNGDFLEFIEDGGYEKPGLWLSEGWSFIRNENIKCPLYWIVDKDDVAIFSLNGMRPLNPDEPLSHVSYHEAYAYAAWKNARLPREEELEIAGTGVKISDLQNFMELGHYNPDSYYGEPWEMKKLFGDVWEWTSSQYAPYPGGFPLRGELGEYNFKFMSSQYVLRGGSCITPKDHFRNTYRNYYPSNKRWEMSGIRLARDGGS